MEKSAIHPHFLVSKDDTEKWEEEVGKAQETLRRIGKHRARSVVSYIMNTFLFFTHPNAYDTKTYHPLREEVLMQILLHPGESVFSIAKYVCAERGGEKADPEIVARTHREILNGRLLPKSPLCFQRKCKDEPRQPIRVYPTLFLARNVQDNAKGERPIEKVIENARIADDGRTLLVNDNVLYPNKWHYPAELLRTGDKKEGDAVQRAAMRLFGSDLHMEGVSYERPSMQRLELGELLWQKVYETTLSDKSHFQGPEGCFRWWTKEQIQNDLNSVGEHEIEDLHAWIELRIRLLRETRLESWRNRSKIQI